MFPVHHRMMTSVSACFKRILSARGTFPVSQSFRTVTMTRPIAVGPVSRHAQSIVQAQGVLLSEGIVAVPTDTVYGLAGLAQSSTAIRKLYAIKKRDPLKPLAISVANVDDVYKWAQVTIPRELLNELLPGAVTLIFNRTNLLNPEFNPETSLVGVRIPDFPYIRLLSLAVGGPLALTSANVSSAASTLSVEEFTGLWPQLDLVVDAGPLCQLGTPQEEQRKGSTVIDLSVEGYFQIVRPGCCLKVTKDHLLRYGLKERRH